MGQILFPTDLGNSAKNAFVYALQIANVMELEIHTLHVYRQVDLDALHAVYEMDDIYKTVDLERFGSFKKHIEELRKIAIKHNMSHINLTHSLVEGKIENSILRVAKEEEADYIVMGTMGANFLKEIFVGSIAGEVMEKAPCWVFSIPVNLEFDGKIDQIVVTTSFQKEEATALRQVAAFAEKFDAHVRCIHVDIRHTADLSDKMSVFQAQFSDLQNVSFSVLPGNYVEETIGEYVKENQIDLVCMLTHERNFFEELFNYSNAKKLSYHLRTAVGAIPAATVKSAD